MIFYDKDWVIGVMEEKATILWVQCREASVPSSHWQLPPAALLRLV